VIAAEGPTLPGLARHTSSRLDQVSLIFLSGSFGYLVGSFLGGRVYDRLPGHRFMTFVLLFLALTTALVPLAHSLTWLVLSILVLGLAKGALDVGCNTLLLWVYDDKVGPFMNGLHACFGIGAFISPLVVAGVVSLTGDINWVFWSFAIAALPIAVFIGSLPSPAQRLAPAGESTTTFPLMPVLLMALCFAAYVGAEVGFGNWLFTYATLTGLGTTISAAYMTSAFWGSFTVGRLAGVWISTRARPRTILFTDLAGCLASLALILLWPGSVAALWIGSIGAGLFMASIFPSQLTLAEERMHVSGTITSIFLVGSGVGGMILPWLIGQMILPLGPTSMLGMAIGSLTLNLLGIYVFSLQKSSRIMTRPAEPA
jgi:FHS family Na+ dependent glucose MFS transporter 1